MALGWPWWGLAELKPVSHFQENAIMLLHSEDLRRLFLSWWSIFLKDLDPADIPQKMAPEKKQDVNSLTKPSELY
jgi:hypothetical protein